MLEDEGFTHCSPSVDSLRWVRNILPSNELMGNFLQGTGPGSNPNTSQQYSTLKEGALTSCARLAARLVIG